MDDSFSVVGHWTFQTFYLPSQFFCTKGKNFWVEHLPAAMFLLRSEILLPLCCCASLRFAEWTQLSSTGDTPSVRLGPAMATLTDGTAVVFGGFVYDNVFDLTNVLHTLEVSVAAATWIELAHSGDIPSERFGHTMTQLMDGTTVVFGGFDGDYLDDAFTLEVSGVTAIWTPLVNSGDIPSARTEHTVTQLTDGSAVLFGGRDASKLNDVYMLELSGTTATWTELQSSGDVPSARSDHAMTTLLDGRVVVFGGSSVSGDVNDVYTLEVSGTTATWTELVSEGDVPSERSGHSMTQSTFGFAVMFGGSGVGGYLNDVHMLEVSGATATWTELESLGDVPSARRHHAMTALHDGSTVLFGGTGVNGRLNDVYNLELPTSLPTPLPPSVPTSVPTSLPTQSPTPVPTQSPTGSLATSPASWPSLSPTFVEVECVDGVILQSTPTTCDTYESMNETNFCEFDEVAEKCCYCDGGSGGCEDDDLPASVDSGGSFTCQIYEILYGVSACSGPVNDHCCFCGGGTCINGVLDGEFLMCGELADLGDNQAHCENDDIARACCHCATDDQVTPHDVQITLDVSSTAEGEEQICAEASVAPGGDTFQSFVLAFVTAGTSRSSSSVTLSCTDRRLAGNHVRRLQADFALVAWTRFADEIDASAFFGSVNATGAEMALNFQNFTAANVGVRVLVAVSHLELTVADAASSCRGSGLLLSTVAAVVGVAYVGVDTAIP